MENKIVFVTVGTTTFDDLIITVTSDEILHQLNARGYKSLIMQIGESQFVPNCSPRCGFSYIEAFSLKPSLCETMKSADLIISHAGAGSCLEALDLKKPLIVVTNNLLMNNHQVELAKQLCNDGYLYYSTCKNLLELIIKMKLSELKTFPGDKSHAIANVVNKLMGFS
ncbi:UDP-N-acetylglucosamine transferase subunit ALG13 homolog [Trichogramma pretiosum]|uniref:UDP-N-acetylglucosamine transferase subunit ALG13 homolog n=1 Tax=Trichogramma pretiosum TaxID=7493 RepID=UPI0006C999AE|nr:UDP-N-acetylglucosamine transferase subunit ALG13 homolog [Trichogramma pretiosum]XP_014224203.1 UDP-N-acetylglucosamine transferase subunit ALG13 homolog [Trichogramma pretiosum]